MKEANSLKVPTTLRELREKQGYSQEYVAHQVGLTRNAYLRYEQRQAEPKILNFIAMARFYKVSLKKLALLMDYDVSNVPDDHPIE